VVRIVVIERRSAMAPTLASEPPRGKLSSCQMSVSSKPAMSGPASTRISVSSPAHPAAEVVLDAFAQGVLAGADAAQPAQPSETWRGVSIAVDDLEPDAVTGV
jgi:hypothetical protein